MKVKIHFLLFFISVLLSNCASTQSNSNSSAGINTNPELAADKLTVDMVAQLQLSDEQTPKVKAINLKYLKKSQDIQKEAGGDRSAMKYLKTNMQKEKNIEMKHVLTSSQYKKYESMLAENKSSRGQKGSGGRSRN